MYAVSRQEAAFQVYLSRLQGNGIWIFLESPRKDIWKDVYTVMLLKNTNSPPGNSHLSVDKKELKQEHYLTV